MARDHYFPVENEFINDPKMRRYFSKSERCDWVCFLCLVSKSEECGVVTIPDDQIAYALDLTDEEWADLLARFTKHGMVTRREEDGALVCLNWKKHRYKKPSDEPDAVADRVSRHREAKRNAVTAPVETPAMLCNALKRDVTPCNATDKIRERLEQTNDRSYVNGTGSAVRSEKDVWEPEESPPPRKRGKDFEGYITRMEAAHPAAMPYVDHVVTTQAKTAPVPFRASIWRAIESGETPESVWRSFVPPPPPRVAADTPDDPARPQDKNGSVFDAKGRRVGIVSGCTDRPAPGWPCEDGYYYPLGFPATGAPRVPLPDTFWAAANRRRTEEAKTATAVIVGAAGMPA